MPQPSRSVSQSSPSATQNFPWEEYRKLKAESHLVRLAKALLMLQDRWAAYLKPPEYRAVEFVLRQTVAFRKDWDTIAIEQFAGGVGGRPGIGVTRANVHVALAPLLDCGLLVKDSYQRGVQHAYRINLDVLFGGEPDELLRDRDRKAGQGGGAPKRSPASETSQRSPAGETTCPAGETTFPQEVLLAGHLSPASETHSLKEPFRKPHSADAGAFCPQCMHQAWRKLADGSLQCRVCYPNDYANQDPQRIPNDSGDRQYVPQPPDYRRTAPRLHRIPG